LTVKDKVGRVRYVAFRVAGQPRARGELASQLSPPRKLTRFDGTYGIARTTHLDQDGLVARLRALGLETLATSGTIRQAAAALPAGTGKREGQSPSPRGRLK